ncbi:MAG: hypothetical protein ACFFA0_07400 [Promethearchaeota archaeon]
MILSKKIIPLLRKMLKSDEGIKAIYITDESGEIIANAIKDSFQLNDIDFIAKKSGIIYKELKKIENAQIIGDFNYVTAEFHENGRITHISLKSHVIVIIGEYCPNLGTIRLIIRSVREDLTKILYR